MRVLETAATFDLPDGAAWLLGDVHGNTRWLQRALPAMRRTDPGLRTVLQLGDWWQDSRPADHWAQVAGIERILVTLGNHEPYGEIAPVFAENPGQAVRISQVVWIMPRPFRFAIGGRSVISLGGAASADTDARTEGVDWWSDEEISDAQVTEAIAGGPAEVMLTHESPDSTPVLEVRRELDERTRERDADVAEATRRSRLQIDRVVSAVAPHLHAHGHFHVAGEGVTEGGRKVVSLARDTFAASVARLDLTTLDVSFLRDEDVWHRRR